MIRVPPALWTGLLVATGVGAAAAAFVVPIGKTSVVMSESRSSVVAVARRYRTDSLARLVVKRDLFRADRRPSPVEYSVPALLTNQGPLPPPKPALRLVGIIAGASPSAIVEGFPGISGSRVVQQGDVVGQLAIVSISGSAVRVSGMDTVWILQVVTPWK